MKLTPFDQLICRTPAFSIDATLEENWEALKVKISESSPVFFNEIKAIDSEGIEQLDEKTKFTIWKYFNRAKFRSTPFGSFAALSLIALSYKVSKAPVIAQELIRHYWVDWSMKESYFSPSVSNANHFLSNSSMYFINDEIRYIKNTAGEFELAAVAAHPELNAILLSCKRKTSLSQITELMKFSFGSDEGRTIDILQQLVELQLLFSDQQANITGQDYFQRLQIPFKTEPKNYIICERANLSGNFDGRYLKNLPEMINFFTQHFPVSLLSNLELFKQAFNHRFEQMEINLAQLMDPEIGIGYGNLEQLKMDNLIEQIKTQKKDQPTKNIRYDELQQFLLRKIISGNAVDLSEFQSATNYNSTLPNTFSLIFHLYQTKPVLAHTGGSTANALLGRFTLCGAEFEQYGHQISAVEIAANPDVIFFDIAYQAEKKVDNVNRRKQLYNYELPILTWSETASPLELTDIMVSIEKDQLILKSKKLGKRLMPRVASAYNYTRSDLGVYRFLCDIQNQNLLTSFSFKLQDFFPELDHYARVSFKTIIISPAMWRIPKAAIGTIENLQHWILALGIEDYFRIGHGDQSLCINPRNEKDLWALLNYCKQHEQEQYLSEALFDNDETIIDENANHYHPQYVVNYYHQDKVYEASSPKMLQKSEFHLPGSEWVYFQIYSHPSKSNLFLSIITKLIAKNKALLKKWFFIRYADPKPHIRLRLQLKKPAEGYAILHQMKEAFTLAIQQGFIADFKLQTYQKETQRYGANRMELVEQFFHTDSSFTLKLLKNIQDENQLMIKTVRNIQALCEIVNSELQAQVLFAEKMSAIFANEHQLNPADFKKINSNFNALKVQLFQEITLQNNQDFVRWLKAFTTVIQQCENHNVKEKMLADLIHMHINRLFIIDQRVYETIIYHYLKRLLQIKLAVSKAEQVY